jgi:hypothetical protein
MIHILAGLLTGAFATLLFFVAVIFVFGDLFMGLYTKMAIVIFVYYAFKGFARSINKD